jgi:hypothetical protein
MKCNCVRDNEPKVAEHISKQLGVPVEAKAQGVAFVFGKNPGEMPFMPYTVKADKPGYRAGKKTVNMFFTFCPWCGERLEEEENG